MTSHNWIDLSKDADTGIETLRAHFQGHAYDPHWHDSYLVGVTEQGVQQFNCRRARHQSTPGKVFCLSLAFFVISVPCLSAWALLGAASSHWLSSATAVQRFNRGMALLLLGSAWLSVLA